jgi:16S rRNA (cytidine1402-2'-O)-methyltransferase
LNHRLYIVPTPIGNLADITLRAIETLKSVDVILCEDTRQSSKLLNYYEISKPLTAIHKMNEYREVDKLILQMKAGKTFAIISDAGTPLISDPGNILIEKCIDNQIEIECLPGATAFVPALVNSGFDLSEFVFLGFPPHKKGRQTFIKSIALEKRTIVLYESPYRVVKFLEEFLEFVGDERRLSISRELSKKFEETIRGSAVKLLEHFQSNLPKGEFVIVVSSI